MQWIGRNTFKMDKLTLKSVDDFLQRQGEKLGTSDWLLIGQSMIDEFAGATLDYQWIHVDAERAKSESPYHTTIAHGYLTLSLLVYLLESAFKTVNVTNIINYGVDKMMFKTPVCVNSKVRLHVDLVAAKDLGIACQAKLHCVMEIEGVETPALEGQITFVYYFDTNK
jgi:acyl dehydratase